MADSTTPVVSRIRPCERDLERQNLRETREGRKRRKQGNGGRRIDLRVGKGRDQTRRTSWQSCAAVTSTLQRTRSRAMLVIRLCAE